MHSGSMTASNYSLLLGNGSYSYTIQTNDKMYKPTNSSNTLTVNGLPLSISTKFNLLIYEFTFEETNAPLGSSWYVNVTNTSTSYVMHSGQLSVTSYSLNLTNGSYTYTIQINIKTYSSSIKSGNLTVAGPSTAVISTTFSKTAYKATFTESGLPTGTSWNLTFNRNTYTLTNTSYSFMVVNGTYTYKATSTDYYTVSNSVTVNGTSHLVPISFVSHGYKVTFTESGLPSGTAWYVNITGHDSGKITTSTYNVSLVNGTYTYKATSVDYTTTSNSVTVNGANQPVTLKFTLRTYTVTFTETGLPSGTAWYVNITGHDSGKITSSTYNVSLSNGTYTYTVGTVHHNYTASGATITVNGHALSKSIVFSSTPAKANDDAYIIVAVVVVAAAIIGSAVLFTRRKP
jgi:hypothetical protein